jgi:outer membrane protein assembly factor BamB
MGDIDEHQYLFALNQEDGSIAWKAKVGNAWEDRYGGPRSTPTFSDGRLYTVTTDGDVHCLEAKTGAVVWKKSLTSSFEAGLMQAQDKIDWRFAESPLVDGNRVIVTPGHRHAALVALDKANGEEIWRSEIPEIGERGRDGAAYSSVVVSHGGGVKQYVQLIGRGLIGVEAETGRFLWGYNRVANDVANIATPIVHGDYIFTSTGYRTGSALLKLSARGDGVKAEEVYWLEPNVMQNHHGGLILHEGYIYTGTGHNKGFSVSAKFETGEVAWGPIRNEGADSAAIAYADGRLYLRYQNGLVILIEATPEGYKERGSFMLPDVEKPSWPHPVITGGRLYLREQNSLFCYDVTAGQSTN